MALILKDRVKETTTVTSTGTATLLGAVAGYQGFSAIGNGNTCYYTIAAQTGSQWEVGIGTYTSPDQLSRDTVLASSNGGALVNFSAGTKDVFVTQPAEKAVYTDSSNIVNALGNATSVIAFADINTTNLTANTVTITAGTITTSAANNTDITNKLYVDTVAATGLTYHTAVQAATTQSLAAQTGGVVVYNNGVNGVGATLTLTVALTTLDGYSLANTNRILVKDETNQTYNGIYTWATGGTVLTRATDADTYGTQPNQLSLNDYFYVQNGNVNKGSAWVVDAPTGTITFGTSNIAFAQFSSAQVYSAGTGLSLNNTTFSIANTAVTAAQYGNDGNVAQFTVNAQGQLTNAANVAINASSISVGTLANARTTASDANGASTIVARDSTGSFTANTITATTSNATTFNGTTGAFTNVSGNGIALTAINASNISSGTIANARTTGNTANSASTLVLRDADGSFGANVVTATFSGNAAGLSAINASNISSGTIANARTTAASANGASTIVLRDTSGNFDANTVNASSFVGNGVAITAINASNISTGTISNARTTASSANGASTIVLRDTNGSFDANVIGASSFSGNGAAITAINASNISSGTLASARISGSYTGITGVGTLTAGTWNGNTVGILYGGTGQTTANGAFNALAPSQTSNSGKYLTTDGSNTSWGTVSTAVTVTDNTSTNATFYPLFTSATSGNISGANVSSTELTFNPGTNVLSAPNMQATNGIFANNRTVGTSYSIPSGYSAVSTGPVTLSNGVSVTVPSGGKWVVL